MKLIKAIIKPYKLNDVKEALSSKDLARMTIYEVKGFGRQKGHKEIYRGSEYQVDFIPKLAVEIVVTDDQAETAMEAIRQAAHTDSIGDGKIFVIDVEQAMRIRTGETGADAL
ncbi:P-II family nitrogen regulator [Candidatus Sumerlaeota bacterium]|nr:P-II family nitrogen regulator [Candidatus Sumerlaeota bacterium]